MSTIAHPDLPAVSNYPTQLHEEELETALNSINLELSTNEGWEDQGERDGVQLYRKPDPENANNVPTVKGTAIVNNCTSEQFLATIQLSGMRKRWDPRFESGHMLSRYSRLSYCFYSEMKGVGWLVYPRDIVGVQKNFKSNSELNQKILVVQTSVVENELAPEQSGKTRAHLTISGWELLPQGVDLKVTYVVKIHLNGSMPLQMVDMIAKEIPLCVGRARDVFYRLGFAPYVQLTPGQSETTVIFQNETFSDLVPTLTDPDASAKEFYCTFTTSEGGLFDFIYDIEKMYKGGIEINCTGEDVEFSDDGVGKVSVKCGGKGGENVTVCIKPKV